MFLYNSRRSSNNKQRGFSVTALLTNLVGASLAAVIGGAVSVTREWPVPLGVASALGIFGVGYGTHYLTMMLLKTPLKEPIIAETAEAEVEAIARRGQELFQAIVAPKIEPGDRNKFVVIDVVSGDWEIGSDDLAAEDRLLERHPDAQMFALRADGGAFAYAGSAWTP